MSNIKNARLNLNISQLEASLKLGISPQKLSRYELEQSEPNFELLKKMSNVYSVSIDYLLSNDTTNKIVYSDKQKRGMQSYLKLEEPYLTMANTYLQNLLDDQEQLQARKNKLWNN